MWGTISNAELRSRAARWTAVCAVLAVCALWVVALVRGESAQAAEAGCNPTCVILIQVDGLEPKDVTQATTPYLWSLAHPPAQAQGDALAGRSGWIWQAGRGVMSTGTASATASLLTGAFPERTQIPSDEFFDLKSDDTHQRLGAGGFGDVDDTASNPVSSDGATPVGSANVPTLMESMDKTQAAVFVADPAVARVAHANEVRTFWYPPGDSKATASNVQSHLTGDPRLCPVPRWPDGGSDQTHSSPGVPNACPANDLTTLNKAQGDLAATPDNQFAFIHLAELGVAKRRAGDTDVAPSDVGVQTDQQPPSVPQALSDLDAAVATFAEQYAQAPGGKWGKTVLMVVGDHGYQTTPVADRVPDPSPPPPDQSDPSQRDLTDYVHDFSSADVVQGELTLVPQGTMGTIYFKAGQPLTPEDVKRRPAALQAIRDNLLKTDPGSVNAACQSQNQQLGACIKEVLYLDDDAAEPGNTAAGQHKTWHLDGVDDQGQSTRTSGDLAVVLTRGWALGRVVGVPTQPGQIDGQPVTNPYTASAGGPQERAVAALINGPKVGDAAVRNLDQYGQPTAPVNYYPVASGPVDPSDPDNPPRPETNSPCPDTTTDPGGLTCANAPAKVDDDAEDSGHEAQPVTVDFAATISALLQIGFADSTQLQGRILQEAFVHRLAQPCVGEECGKREETVAEDTVIDVPPPPQEVIRPPGFNFFGLVRDLKARVVDSRNNTYAQAKRGTQLSTIRLEGDFGKPEAAMTLTFYRATGGRKARSSRRLSLKAIARFDPFVIKRGHVTIRLKVPPVFRPTYVGVTVREIVRGSKAQGSAASGPCTKIKTLKPVKFRCTGPSRAIIAPIVDAAHLHQRKGRTRR